VQQRPGPRRQALYRLHPIRRGDVVVFDRPRKVVDPDKY
jgi:hypothetical protein